jgi:hypothetical protein
LSLSIVLVGGGNSVIFGNHADQLSLHIHLTRVLQVVVLNRDSFFYWILFAAHSGAATAAAVAAGNRTISFQGMWNKACLSKSMPPEADIIGGIYFL